MTPWTVCLTFDIDLVTHADGGQPFDEFSQSIPAMQAMFERHPGWTATWFVRIDDHIAATLGDADAIFTRHAGTLSALRSAGHEIGWHPHSYSRSTNGSWVQNTDEQSVVDELTRLAPVARRHTANIVRTGWGFHTNKTMRAVADAGFAIDSSAMPRPKYAWEMSVKDWTTTPGEPFHPSAADYRVPGLPQLPILEVPISVAPLRAPNDNGVVMRYLNPAFHESAFAPAVSQWLNAHDHLVTITHPYELTTAGCHDLIAYDIGVFERNVMAIEARARNANRGIKFSTLTQFSQSR